MNQWRIFERLVAILSSEEYHESYTVIPNARIKGHISKRRRQLDVLVDYRYEINLSKRIIIDAKYRKRPIDIKEVESFEGLMKDVGASRGVLFCSNGYTKTAMRRAQEHIGIRLVPTEEIETFDLSRWDKCRDDRCEKGLVLWDATPGIILDGTVTVQSTGKCDECGKYHIWCWGCEKKHVMEKEDDWQCACEEPWFWLTAIEEEQEDGRHIGLCNYLMVLSADASCYIIDRRPL